MNKNMNCIKFFIRSEIIPVGYAICDKIKNNKLSIDKLINTTSINNNKNEEEQLFHHYHRQQHHQQQILYQMM